MTEPPVLAHAFMAALIAAVQSVRLSLTAPKWVTSQSALAAVASAQIEDALARADAACECNELRALVLNLKVTARPPLQVPNTPSPRRSVLALEL